MKLLCKKANVFVLEINEYTLQKKLLQKIKIVKKNSLCQKRGIIPVKISSLQSTKVVMKIKYFIADILM